MYLRCVASSVLFDMHLPLPGIPLLQLKVPVVCCGTSSLSLQNDEDDGANHGDEVQWKEQQVSDQGVRRELLEWLLHQFAQSRNVVSADFDLSSFSYQIGTLFRQQGAIERIDKRLLDKKRSRDQIDDD